MNETLRATAPLDALFVPRSIAVIGASDDPASPGGNLIRNLLSAGYPGRIFPVSARRDEVIGLPTTKGIAELPDDVDLAVIAVPAQGVSDNLRAFADHGTGGALVLSSGFAELGHVELQRRLVEVVRTTGIRVCGPNCAGYLNQADGISANFVRWTPTLGIPRQGPIAVISQSGGFGNLILRRAKIEDIGCNWFISTGNEADVSVAIAIHYAVERPEVGVVLAYAESIQDGDDFVAAAMRARELDKPIVILKVGRSEVAAQAALTHTASITGSTAAFDAVCKQFGVHVADSIDDLMDLALMFSDARRARGRRVGVLTASGGVGVAFTDALGVAGLEVPELTAEDCENMSEILPENFLGSLTNPVDLGTQAPVVANPFGAILRSISASPVVDLLAPILYHYSPLMVEGARTAFHATDLPMAVLSPGVFPPTDIPNPPVYTDPRRAARALFAVVCQSEPLPAFEHGDTDSPVWADAVEALIDAGGTRPFLLESDALRAFGAMGIPVVPSECVGVPAAAGEAFERLGGGPVVAKVMSYEVPHKTEAGAVRLDLTSKADVVEACNAMADSVRTSVLGVRIEGFLVQTMVPARLELTCGLHRDPTFGPMVVVGLGGVMIELLAETVMLRAPFSQEAARHALRSLLKGRIVTARRGLGDDEVAQLGAIAHALGQLAVLRPDVRSIDINPLRVANGQVVAVDALIERSLPA